MSMLSTVTVRGQTAIPAAIRRRYGILPKSHIEWIDDGHSIAIVPKAADPIKALRGKYRGQKLGLALSRLRKDERKRGV
jgi:bifunctional DNA-binding transcriptional regulator/antitoxin component of YhaV-PrlF toxin-antitoxin module